jgi:hypothetical protein
MTYTEEREFVFRLEVRAHLPDTYEGCGRLCLGT